MTLSGIIYITGPRAGPWSRNKVGKNTFKNTPEDDLDTFCDINVKKSPELFCRTGPYFEGEYFL